MSLDNPTPEPSEHVDEDVTAERIGYCELNPECCETIKSESAGKRPTWWSRLLRTIFTDDKA